MEIFIMLVCLLFSTLLLFTPMLGLYSYEVLCMYDVKKRSAVLENVWRL